MICEANQWAGFYMISASVMKGLSLMLVMFNFVPLIFFSVKFNQVKLKKMASKNNVWCFDIDNFSI